MLYRNCLTGLSQADYCGYFVAGAPDLLINWSSGALASFTAVWRMLKPLLVGQEVRIDLADAHTVGPNAAGVYVG
jgi:hypothetical protein